MDHGICRCQISPNSPCLPPRCSALLPSIPLRVKSKRIFRGGWDAFGLEGSNLTKHLFVLTQTSHPHLIASMRRKWTVQWRLLIAIAPTDVFPFICTFRYKMYNGIMTCRLPTWIYFAQVFSLFFSLWILKIFIFIFLFISKIIITQYCDSSDTPKTWIWTRWFGRVGPTSLLGLTEYPGRVTSNNRHGRQDDCWAEDPINLLRGAVARIAGLGEWNIGFCDSQLDDQRSRDEHFWRARFSLLGTFPMLSRPFTYLAACLSESSSCD